MERSFYVLSQSEELRDQVIRSFFLLMLIVCYTHTQDQYSIWDLTPLGFLVRIDDDDDDDGKLS